MNVRDVIGEANRLLTAGLQRAASAILEEYLSYRPNDPLALRALGRVRMLQGRPHEAAPLLQRALSAIDRRDATVHAEEERGARPVSLESRSEIDEDDLALIEATHAEREGSRERYAPGLEDGEAIATSIDASSVAREPAADTLELPVSALDAPTPTQEPPLQEPPALEPPSSPPTEHSVSPDVAPVIAAEVPLGAPQDNRSDEGEEFPEQLALLYLEDEGSEEKEQLAYEKQLVEDAEAPDYSDDGADYVDDSEGLELVSDQRLGATALNWDELDVEPEEFEEAPTREEVEQEVRTGGGLLLLLPLDCISPACLGNIIPAVRL